MRGVLIALVALLLVLPAGAGPGHSGGVPGANQNVPFYVSLEGSNVTGGPLLIPAQHDAGAIVISALNRGTHPMRIELFLEETVVNQWMVPADRETHTLQHAIATPGNVSVDFSSPSAPANAKQTMDVNIDWSGGCDYNAATCIWKLLAWEIANSAIVFDVDTAEAGQYQAAVPEPPAHRIVVQVWDGTDLLSESAPSNGDGKETRVLWNADAGGQYHVVVKSVELVDNRLYPNGGPSVSARVSLVVDGPLVKSTPAPLGVFSLLALVALARRYG